MGSAVFRPRSAKAQQTFSLNHSRPLLQVLDYGQSPGDFIKDNLQGHWQIVFKGETDVYISRAEIDLKKAIQSLNFLSDGSTNSFPTLTALSLPGTATALFWSIHALLQQTYQKPNLENPIRRRNHDARLLYQQLAQLDLVPWYIHSVDKATLDELPAGIEFPAGDPIPGQMYRQHPLKSKHHCYYPVPNYFSLLFEEREQALLDLLCDLGATKIEIAPLNPEDSSTATDENHQKVFEYAKRARSSAKSIDTQHYPWLAHEPAWRSVVNKRLNKSISSTQFEFDIDVMGLMRTQIQTIAQLVPEFDSMMLPDNVEEAILRPLLQTHRVQVEFG